MKHLIALLLLVSVSFAQNNTGTLVIAPIRPQAANDTFPSAIANEIKGGPFSVSNVAAMSNIPSERLVAGALVYVTNDNSFRLYNGASWSQSGVRDAIGVNGSIPLALNTGSINDGSVGTTVDLAAALWDRPNDTWSMTFDDLEPQFNGNDRRDNFRIALGFSQNLTNLWLATNASNARSAVGLGWSALTNTNAETFRSDIGVPSFFGSGVASAIGGGGGNTASGNFSTVGGGDNNSAEATNATITGGYRNTASGVSSTVAGGNIQTASGFVATVVGGAWNTSSGVLSTVVGGAYNTASGDYSVAAGGYSNEASTAYSFVAGYRALAPYTGAFVWSDNSDTNSFQAEHPYTFNVRSIGGMSLNLGTNGIEFRNSDSATSTRANLGFSTNLNSLWTATNQQSARSALGLGETNAITFSNIANNGNFTNKNGTIYGLKTNVGPFEGIGNFFASNNTTVGNETLFRVGVAEDTNKSAQFGFRVARTNNGGEGLAVFSVFGYNALMMIGPSDRSRSNSLTNTNAAIEADIWTMSESDRVMTLKDTNTGAMVMHRPIGFNTNNSNVLTTAPANTNVTNPTGWIQFYVGTNSVRVPYY